MLEVEDVGVAGAGLAIVCFFWEKDGRKMLQISSQVVCMSRGDWPKMANA